MDFLFGRLGDFLLFLFRDFLGRRLRDFLLFLFDFLGRLGDFLLFLFRDFLGRLRLLRFLLLERLRGERFLLLFLRDLRGGMIWFWCTARFFLLVGGGDELQILDSQTRYHRACKQGHVQLDTMLERPHVAVDYGAGGLEGNAFLVGKGLGFGRGEKASHDHHAGTNRVHNPICNPIYFG